MLGKLSPGVGSHRRPTTLAAKRFEVAREMVP